MRTKLRRLGWYVSLLVLTTCSEMVLAQDPGDFRELKAEQPYVPWAIGVAFLVVTLVVVFKKPRRSHED